jgi:hypothetical protein
MRYILKKPEKYMTEPKKNKKAAGITEDWAIIPFDEAEDDARWEQLIVETGKLIEETRALETAHGKILMANKLSDIKVAREEIDDAPF